ncbi:hypothetical protein SH449x_000489 [Pirellulaceae bacterium SH449]
MSTRDVSVGADTIGKISLNGERPAPSVFNGALGVFRYELSRSLTPFRVLLWFALMLFPVVLVGCVRFVIFRTGAGNDALEGFPIVLFILLPEVITILCMLLWATPIVNAELESQTWVYSVVRPRARWSLIIGKYLVAVFWTASCTSLAATLSIPILGISGAWKVWIALIFLCFMAAFCYGSLFMLIGTLFQRRAMVVAFLYAIIVEFLLATIPAVINRFTFSFRLWSIFYNSIDLPPQFLAPNFMIQDASTPGNIAVLVSACVCLLASALWRIQKSQFRWQSEV